MVAFFLRTNFSKIIFIPRRGGASYGKEKETSSKKGKKKNS
ncbi:MAG: hypothetical protein AAB933_03325 [Patescibacteria group bacterium]